MRISPLIYDFKRTIKGKAVIVIIILVIIFSLLFIPFAKNSSGIQVTFQEGYSFGYYKVGNLYHLIFFVYNGFGQGLQNANLTLTLSNYNGTSIYKSSMLTNSMGIANFTVSLPQINSSKPYYLSMQISYASGQAESSFKFQNAIYGNYNLVNALNIISDPNNTSKKDLLVFAFDSDGGKPLGFSVYYSLQNSYQINSPSSLNKTELLFLKNISNYINIISLVNLEREIRNYSAVSFYLFDSKGGLVEESSYSTQFLYSSSNQLTQSPSSLASNFITSVLAFLFPLMAIISSYSVYGKDKVTGVLESVLVRPISRRGLAISRFISNTLAIIFALIVSIVILDLISFYLLGSFLPSNLVLLSIGSIVVEVIAFIGISYFLSHVVKSSGTLLGLLIFVYILYVFFWSLIVFAISNAMGIAFNSSQYILINLISYFFNPYEFPSLVNVFLNNNFIGLPINPSLYGVNIYTLTIDGLAWLIIPFLAYLYLATKRD
jgi:ABC-2 type transport system permease protein